MDSNDIIKSLRDKAKGGAKASELLRFLVTEHGICQAIVWMELFRDAFEVNLGALTAIGAWWYEGESELSDEDLNAYIHYVIDDYINY